MNVAPLTREFMIVSIIGLLVSIMFLPQYSLNWAFIVGILSFAGLVASIISFTKGPVEDELALDRKAYRYVKPHNEDLVLFNRSKKSKTKKKK